ncbi:hypothetical protein ACFVY1_21480 [Streptomyces sp. NPDC058293]|uniref:hypothetical protein n=1 Tax=Streptomyces sp. NPDC058293 TaxID=3346429 RepID=UPI0036EAF291
MRVITAAGGDAGAAVFGVDETGDGGVLDHAEREARRVGDAVRPEAGAVIRDEGVRIAARGAAQELAPGRGDTPSRRYRPVTAASARARSTGRVDSAWRSRSAAAICAGSTR